MRVFAPGRSPAHPHPADVLRRAPGNVQPGPVPAEASPGPAYDFSRVPVTSVQRAAADGEAANGVPSIVHDVLRAPGRPLDPGARAFFEPRLGVDFGRVRIHTDARAAESAQAVGARAYTVGSDVVMGAGQFAPRTPAGQRLLAHELAHVVQQGGRPAVLARTPATAPAPTGPTREEQEREAVEDAARWMASLAGYVETRRQLAAEALARTSGVAAAARAFHPLLNQEMLGNYLTKAISVFEAQRSHNPQINFPAESPGQTRLGAAFARATEQIGLAMNEARANAANLAPTLRESEEAAYQRNHQRWLEANPAMPLNAGIRTTFTQGEVDISTRRFQQVSAEVTGIITSLHEQDLSGTRAERLRMVLLNAVYRLERDAAGDVHARPDAALQARVQPVAEQLAAIQWALGQAVDRLRRAETRTRAFAADPAGNPAIGDTLQAHFSTRDPGYATLLADRFARMARELRGEGALTVHARRPGDPACAGGSVGASTSVVAAHADANRFHFCSTVVMGGQGIVSTIVHETVHAVIPRLGATGAVRSAADTPDDRAYAYERIYSRLSTEEALANAESYSSYVDELLGTGTRPPAPQDVLRGCSDPGAVHDAIARATYRMRLAAMWAGQFAAPLPQQALEAVRVAFPGADEARVQAILTRLQRGASSLSDALEVTCRPATDAQAAAGALAYGESIRATAGGVAATGTAYPHGTLRICPAWFQAGTEAREDTFTAILVRYYQNALPRADVWPYVALLRHIQQHATPSVAGRTLQQHQAADRPATPAPPGAPSPTPAP
jgi:hypothetical protein